MRHRKHTFKLGRRSAHTKSLLANQVSSLVLCGQIKTTVNKAKETRRIAEKMVTYAKKGDLHHRRLAIAKIKNNNAVKKLFSDIAPRFANRKGGYTRMLKLGKRTGDNADMVVLKWMDAPAAAAPAPAKKGKAEEKPAKKEDKR